jgi:XTP/dITP diphosphohydrolase
VTSIVLATANRHKVAEMRAILTGLGFAVRERPDGLADIDETSDTLEGNALLKAVAVAHATGEAALADDTGLFVDSLDGRPGVFSSRYAGRDATDRDNVEKLLAEMRHVGDVERTARFRTVIALVDPEREPLVVEGVLEGTILRVPRGEGGFGYDPLFVANEAPGRTLAELSPDEKNGLSHRARAIFALAEKLKGR